MASRTALWLIAFLGALLFLQAVVAQEVTVDGSDAVATVTSPEVATSSQDDQTTEIDVSENNDPAFETPDDTEDEELLSSHPLARILHERSSKQCWSSKHCKKHFRKAGCCKKKCVNLASDNKNCGHCGKCCDTKKGLRCMSGKCVKNHSSPQCTRYKKCKSGFMCKWNKCVRKPQCSRHIKCRSGYTCKWNKCVKVVHPQSCKSDKHCRSGYVCRYGKCVKKAHPPAAQCGAHKKCSSGHTCCKGKCVNLRNNPGHCGRCDKGCGYGSKCCHGKCLNVKHDMKNCGACGKRCGFGRVCCHGYCKNIHGSDNHHCGACGKKCNTQCKFGMCGYGH